MAHRSESNVCTAIKSIGKNVNDGMEQLSNGDFIGQGQKWGIPFEIGI